MKYEKPLVMGIVNITPDSFYESFAGEQAVKKAEQFINEGADILDLGAESTRPGAEYVPAEEEGLRLLPVLKEIRKRFPKTKISVDTYKPEVADAALEAGADIINDIASKNDPLMFSLVADHKASIVLMHMKGTPQNMTEMATYKDILREMKGQLEEKIERCLKVGMKENQIIIDPGFGFAKNKEQNMYVLSHLEYFVKLGFPVLAALSRKRFLTAFEGDSPADRLPGTLAANTLAYTKGARIFRVHDVREHRFALDFAAQTLNTEI